MLRSKWHSVGSYSAVTSLVVNVSILVFDRLIRFASIDEGLMIKQSAFQISLPRLIRGTADSVIVGLFFL